ncbi:type II toxin-antitoxin system RelE/ParE family toxin [Terriglobus sp.]|uniref:type II toxin-antitoxin system RelE/ParE family toxin n=1 Tax=Terriglobus sp. TaxID=1889013 RepID=UPI003AFFCE0E
MHAFEPCWNANAAPLDVPAADDLEQIKLYLDEHHPQFSNSTVRKLYEEVRSLKAMPWRGRVGLKEGTRELVVSPLPYLVTYRVAGDTVQILRIHHGAQDRWATDRFM